MKNNFSDWLLTDSGTRIQAGQMRLEVRLPWYRSLPLSVVELGLLRVDGREYGAEAVRIEVNGKLIPMSALADLTNEWWFVLDSAYLHFDAPDADPAAQHDVELVLNHYPPYIPGLLWTTRSAKNLAHQPS
ncbi:MAG: DUF6379 domain-containing protein [Pseudomonadota bacterium]